MRLVDRTRRMFKLRAGTFACLVVAGASIGPGNAEAQAPSSSDFTVERMKSDLAVFSTDFLAVDRSYSPAARTAAEARLLKLEARLANVSRAAFELAVAQIVALADNGHTAAFAGPRSRHFNRVPLRVTPFGENFYVLRATTPNTDLLGARVTAIGGVPIRVIRDSARTLVGGVPAWRDRSAGYLIESPEQLHALGLIERADGARYEFEMSSGERITRYLVAAPANTGGADGGASRWLYPELRSDEEGSWQAALAPDLAPWSLQDPDERFRSREVPELDAMVIELRQNRDAPGRPIRTVLREFTRAIQTGGFRHLVLDMRQNGGGDLNTTRDFMEALPTLVPGRIVVLMSPWTFSAAISSIGYLEQAAPDKVTLVGEAPGDRLEFFAEGGIVTLPNSRAVLLYATERHDYHTGCDRKDDCHGPVIRHPIAVPSLAPDVAAPWTFTAYAAGRDPAMEAVAALLRTQP